MARFPRSFTPNVRRLISDVFKPGPSLGKRGRDDENDENEQSRGAPAMSTSSRSPCVALQNEDQDEDAIVITALNTIPFCCHADLLSMTRAHLLAVANTLNAKLPRALKIDVGPARSDVFIRNSIELLVGLRRNIPQTPKPARSRSLSTDHRAYVPVSPASPLATKSRPNVSLGSPALAMLREEDEGAPEPPQKRRRVLQQAVPQIDGGRRITRSQSHHVAPMYIGSPAPASVVRARSQKLPARALQNAHPNVTVTRGRSTSRAGVRARSVAVSTPKKRKYASDDSLDSMASLAAVAAAAIVQTPVRAATSTPLAKWNMPPKRRVGEYSADATELTFGLDGMTMAAVSAVDSDID